MTDDLTRFQIDLLGILGRHGPIKGLDAKDMLERRYGKEVNHGRLYPNLDDLADMGLITKTAMNDRANQYDLTQRGARELTERVNFLLDGVTEDHDLELSSGGRIQLQP